MTPGEPMIQLENVSRRGFLKGLVGTGALVLSVRVLPTSWFGAQAGASDNPMASAALQPNAFVAIATDGTVYIVVGRSEMGSGNRTGLPRIVADEMGPDWKKGKGSEGTGETNNGRP